MALNRGVWVVCIGLVFAVGTGHAQNARPAGQAVMVRTDFSPTAADTSQAGLVREMVQQQNLQRQARMKADADKLFKMASELKDSLDKSNPNILSLDVVKKAQEIEKLAHSVKEKMKGE
jgi:phosphomevalonate kinase